MASSSRQPGYTTASGHGNDHQKHRARLEPQVATGRQQCTEIICLIGDRTIYLGMAWDLAHDRQHPGQYLGPAHRRCNRAEGAAYGNRLRGTQLLTLTWHSTTW